ncbi:MAG: hypothetical protein ACO3S5_11395 [Ilumatobacteraceae bacterium]
MLHDCDADAFGCRHVEPSLSPSPCTRTQPAAPRMSHHDELAEYQSAMLDSSAMRSFGGAGGAAGVAGVMSCTSQPGIGTGSALLSHS